MGLPEEIRVLKGFGFRVSAGFAAAATALDAEEAKPLMSRLYGARGTRTKEPSESETWLFGLTSRGCLLNDVVYSLTQPRFST